MRPFRFLHAADLHLDSPFRGLQPLPDIVRERVRQSANKALDRLVKLAMRERVDFVVVAGDVYDAADRPLRAQLRFREAAEQLAEAGIPLFVVHGNHDPDDGRSAKLTWPESVRFFSTREVECFPVRARDDSGVLAHVYGISFDRAAVSDNLASRFVRREGAPYHVAVLHANVDGSPEHDNYAPCSLRELERSGFDYWALGHIHDRRVLAEHAFVVYPGCIQGRSVKELGAKGCYIVRVDESGGSGLHFHALDDVRWMRLECSIDGLGNEDELLSAVRACLEQARSSADGRAVMLRFALTGRGVLHDRLRRTGLAGELADELRSSEERLAADGGPDTPFVWLESIAVETGSLLDRDVLRSGATFAGELLRLSESLLGDETERSSFIAESLEPLRSQARLRRLLDETDEEQLRGWLRKAESLVLDSLVQEPE